MRLFICEYVTGGGYAGGPLPAGLVGEGDRMLRALVHDAAAVPGVTVVTTRDARLPAAGLPAQVRPIHSGADPWAEWQRAIAAADAIWPVAPETDGLLERLSAMVLAAGRALIGSRPPALRLAASKRATAAALAAAGVPVIPTLAARAGPAPPGGWVVKPDDGAGSEWTRHCRTRAELERALAELPHPIVQPHVAGDPTSMSLLCADGAARLLACNSQIVTAVAGRLRYEGGVVGGREDRRPAYEPIAARIAAAIPGLWGYVGVDLIEGGDGPVVVEVNPRISVPYAGLRAALGVNPAELILGLADSGLPAPEPATAIRPTPVLLGE